MVMICSYIALLLQNTQGRGPRNIEADICDVCNTAAPADLAALARHGKGVTCDPSCVEHEEGDSLYCNALGLVSLFGEHLQYSVFFSPTSDSY